MPARLDRVQFTVGDDMVEVNWNDRQRLLGLLRDSKHDAAASAVHAIEAVGATRPVQLDDDGKDAVEVAITAAFGSSPSRSRGLARLRRALLDDAA